MTEIKGCLGFVCCPKHPLTNEDGFVSEEYLVGVASDETERRYGEQLCISSVPVLAVLVNSRALEYNENTWPTPDFSLKRCQKGFCGEVL
jgi:hypothetical protein